MQIRWQFSALFLALSLVGCGNSSSVSSSVANANHSNQPASSPASTPAPVPSDTVAPVLTLDNDLKNAVSRTSELVLTGKISDNVMSGLSLLAKNGDDSQTANVNDKGEFRLVLPLHAGENAITLTAKDAVGNEHKLQQSVYFGQTLTAGNSHTGILKDGKVYAFGRNNMGQVGIGEFTSVGVANHPSTPVALTTPADVVSIAFNQNHSALLTKDGKVYTWGSDGEGELGRGDANQAKCEHDELCRLDIGLVDGLSDVIAISSGYGHKLALTKSGEVYAFGSNVQGQIGQDFSVEKQSTPIKVDFSANTNMGKIIQVIASSDTSYVLDNKGQVWAWGANQSGNLGTDNTCDEYDPSLTPNCVEKSFKPVQVPFASDVKIVELAVGGSHVLAMTDKGEVYAWGLNFSSQVGYRGSDKLGTSEELPETVSKPTLLTWSKTKPAKHVYANGTTSYVMLNDNKVYAWGVFGESEPDGTPDYVELSEPTDKLPLLTDVNDMAVGALHQIAKRNNGEFFSWGWNFESSLGGKDTAPLWMYNTPISIILPK